MTLRMFWWCLTPALLFLSVPLLPAALLDVNCKRELSCNTLQGGFYPPGNPSFGAHNLQLTNPQITCAGLECEEITSVGLGLEHTRSNVVPKLAL